MLTTLIPVGAMTRYSESPATQAQPFRRRDLRSVRPAREFMVPFSRQSAPLPQEFSLGIGLLTLAFVAMAVTTREKGHL